MENRCINYIVLLYLYIYKEWTTTDYPKEFKLQSRREEKYRKIRNEMGRWFPGRDVDMFQNTYMQISDKIKITFTSRLHRRPIQLNWLRIILTHKYIHLNYLILLCILSLWFIFHNSSSKFTFIHLLCVSTPSQTWNFNICYYIWWFTRLILLLAMPYSISPPSKFLVQFRRATSIRYFPFKNA